MILLVHAAATWFMVGLIWFVQIVHYPLFGFVRADADFGRYHAAHTSRTTLVVGPVMLVEMVTSAWLVLSPPPGVEPAIAWIGLGLLLVTWVSTAAVQVPRHGRLSGGHDPGVVRSLVLTNWVRTFAWSARGVLALMMISAVGSG